jgi:hypothetical protein
VRTSERNVVVELLMQTACFRVRCGGAGGEKEEGGGGGGVVVRRPVSIWWRGVEWKWKWRAHPHREWFLSSDESN